MNLKSATIFFDGLNAALSQIREVRQAYDSQLAFGFNSLMFWDLNERKFSQILAYFLNPNESHGQRSMFLKIFLEHIGLDKILEYKDCNIEYHFNDGAQSRFIDILFEFVIKDSNQNFCIAIENKITNKAPDLKNQIQDYCNHLENKSRGNFLMIYAPLFERDPESNSIENEFLHSLKGEEKLKILSFQGENDKEGFLALIHKWAINCQSERVRYFLLDFEKYIRQNFLNEPDMAESEKIVDFIIKDADNLKTAFEVAGSLENVKQNLWGSFCSKLKKDLAEFEFHEEPIYIKPKGWKNYWIGFQWEGNSIYYGINFDPGDATKAKSQKIDSKKFNEILGDSRKPTESFPWWNWLDYNWHRPEFFLKIKDGTLVYEISKKAKDLISKLEKSDLRLKL